MGRDAVGPAPPDSSSSNFSDCRMTLFSNSRRRSRTIGTKLLHAAAPLVALVVPVGCGEASPPAIGGNLMPDGFEFPYRVEPACPGEGCAYGTWMACDSIPLSSVAGDPSQVVGHLLREERFDVETGTVIVHVPGAIEVLRATSAVAFADGEYTFPAGDTVFVLDYVGEGFFNVAHADTVLEAEVFWPWSNFVPGPAFEYGGRILQADSTSFWVRTEKNGRTGWIPVDGAQLAMNNSLDPAPLACLR